MNKSEFIALIISCLTIIIIVGSICFTIYKVKDKYISNGYEYVPKKNGSWLKVRSANTEDSTSDMR